MTVIDGSLLINSLGTLGGALGMSIALWFQLVSKKDIHPGLVVSFFVVGLTMFLATLGPLAGTYEEALYLRAFAYITFLMFELVAGYYVWTHAEMDYPTKAVMEAFGMER